MIWGSKEGAYRQADVGQLGGTPLRKGKVPEMVNTLTTLPAVNEVFEGIWIPRLQIDTHLSTGRWWYPAKYVMESLQKNAFKGFTSARNFMPGAAEYQDWTFAFGPLQVPIRQTIEILNEDHREYFQILNDLASKHPICSYHPLFVTSRQLLHSIERKSGKIPRFKRAYQWFHDEVIPRYEEVVAPVKPKPPAPSIWDRK